MSGKFIGFLIFILFFALFTFIISSPLEEHIHLGKLLREINKTNDDVVDHSIHEMEGVYHKGNICPFMRTVGSKIHENKSFKILIIGGSVTYGADLRDRNNQRWSNKFTQIMNSGWHNQSVNVVNGAIAACNVDSWIYRVKTFGDADLIIIDTTVNDQGFDLQALPLLYHTFIQLIDNLPSHPALLFHQAFRSALRDKNDINKHCPNDYISNDQGILVCRKWWEMQDFVTKTLKHFRIPYVSYRDLVWPDYYHPPANLESVWNGMSHPDYHAHAMIAKLISYGVYNLLKEIKHIHYTKHCEQTNSIHYISPHLKDASIQELCPHPLVDMQANTDPLSYQSFRFTNIQPPIPIEINHWRFYNDSKQKFGWILELNQTYLHSQCPASTPDRGIICESLLPRVTLSLNIEVSQQNPIIQLLFLKSYDERMGIASLWLDDYRNESIEINSRWDLSYSVTRYASLSPKELTNVSSIIKGDNIILSRLLPGSHVLHISPKNIIEQNNYKWKLLGVIAC